MTISYENLLTGGSTLKLGTTGAMNTVVKNYTGGSVIVSNIGVFNSNTAAGTLKVWLVDPMTTGAIGATSGNNQIMENSYEAKAREEIALPIPGIVMSAYNTVLAFDGANFVIRVTGRKDTGT